MHAYILATPCLLLIDYESKVSKKDPKIYRKKDREQSKLNTEYFANLSPLSACLCAHPQKNRWTLFAETLQPLLILRWAHRNYAYIYT